MRYALLTLALLASTSAESHNAGRHQARNLLAGKPLHGHLQANQLPSFARPIEDGAHPTANTARAHLNGANSASETREEDFSGNTQYIEVERRYILPKEAPETPAQLDAAPSHNTRVERAPPADIRVTLKTLRPLFGAVVQHPARYSWLATKWVAWMAWRMVRFFLGFIWSLVRPFTVPFYIAIVLPSSLAMSIVGELQPLITFLLSASLLGLAIGVCAGLSNGFVSDYIIATPIVNKVVPPARSRSSSSSSSSSYGMSYFDSPSSRRRIEGLEGDEDEDAQIDAEFRASLRFPPMPPPYGRKPRSTDSGSEEGDDEEDERAGSGLSTPNTGSPVKAKSSSQQPQRPGLRHRNVSVSSTGSTSSLKPMPPPALLSPMNERPPRAPKAVRWES